jgi:hypothetical protein
LQALSEDGLPPATALPIIADPAMFKLQARMMLETFGDSYRAYMARTGRVFPSIFLK